MCKCKRLMQLDKNLGKWHCPYCGVHIEDFGEEDTSDDVLSKEEHDLGGSI